MDLWAFEDELDGPVEAEEGRVDETPKSSVTRDIPAPREKAVTKREQEPGERERTASKTPTGGEDRIRMNINKPRAKSRPAGPAAGQSKPESDFDDLDHWEDARLQPEIEELPAELTPELKREVVRESVPVMPVPEAPAPESAPAPAPPPPMIDQEDEFSPVPRENAEPISLRPHLGLNPTERLGMIALALLLVATTISILVFSMQGLPTESAKAGERDFPIQGEKLKVESATSYWRAPITDGPEPDVFRRDTQLLPVLELGLSGGPAAIRVLFRNEERTVVGDAVTRTVHSDGVMKIAATAGFDDLGMHAAYRTGESKPWTIEVYEAPSEDTAGKDFRLLFEMNISTDRR
jgi:hypothetical protein